VARAAGNAVAARRRIGNVLEILRSLEEGFGGDGIAEEVLCNGVRLSVKANIPQVPKAFETHIFNQGEAAVGGEGSAEPWQSQQGNAGGTQQLLRRLLHGVSLCARSGVRLYPVLGGDRRPRRSPRALQESKQHVAAGHRGPFYSWPSLCSRTIRPSLSHPSQAKLAVRMRGQIRERRGCILPSIRRPYWPIPCAWAAPTCLFGPPAHRRPMSPGSWPSLTVSPRAVLAAYRRKLCMVPEFEA
jgi:hypothetical protein